MEASPNLVTRLKSALPQDVNIKAYHLSSEPTSTNALFSPLPGGTEETTICESHFLAISSPEQDDAKEVLVFAIEILIFTTENLTTLFVSKADSSGFSSRVKASKGLPSVVSTVTSTFVDYLLGPRLNRSRVVLSLFARSQNQYLFPGSIENPGKHVLDDRELVKWWCRVLDQVLRLHSNTSNPPFRSSAHLVVPGCDKGETRAFFPPSSRRDPTSSPKWNNSYPVELLATDTSRAPRHLVPRFPDDPKARFLDDLDGDFVDDQGHWRSVKTLDQFWEMMSYRQECSAGRLVGFLWLIFSPGQTTHTALAELDPLVTEQSAVTSQSHASMPTPDNSQAQCHSEGKINQIPLADGGGELKNLASPPSSSPLQDSQQLSSLPNSAIGLSNNHDASHTANTIEEHILQTHAKQSSATKGQLVLNTSQYQTLMDHLLQMDFAGEEKAAESTRFWIGTALELTAQSVFGVSIRGDRILTQPSEPEKAPAAPINMLTAVRKKRKADNIDENVVKPQMVDSNSESAVELLSAAIVRKKPKG
ncbi:uncharacterized protein PV06_08984 [Exophiala oligosperma]|uniref:histone acetyltransferase n=1 Tax=Exophiala oligosperma TaxID=215243 RepID=A0A0D2D7R9_9EURO|nr:uncharacterized protein PV06_08984 [Exophiala oligosperma]KIW39188.1 hypothetical protein PV06_08984 [Exophiala oligosperma]